MNRISVDIRSLTVSYRDHTVLREIDLELESGLIHGIIGPNGAGKSSLLKACLGLVAATGEILVQGTPLRQLSIRARAHLMSYMAQDTAVDADFTGETYVRMARYARVSRFGSLTASDDDAVSAALRLTGAHAWAHRPVAQTSGGERQLTALARAIAQDPAILMLDEPVAALDLRHELDVLRLLRPWIDNAGTTPRTVIAVLHDLSLAARFCDRLTLLADGRVQAHGTPEEVLTAPHLRRSYGVDTNITRDQATHTLVVTPL